MNIKIQSNQFKSQKAQKPNFEKEVSLSTGPNSKVMSIEHQGVKKTLKRVPKTQSLNEIKILQQLDHPNILKLYEFYEDNNEYCIITDFWEGGDLYEYLETHQSIQEFEISEIMKQLFSILKYIHSKNIVHRDIKSENILIEADNDGRILIKLIDWGIATQIEKNKKLYTSIGTPYYMAPEVFKQCYDEKCDIWSAGVLLYEIISGELPFYARQANDIQTLILEKKPNFDKHIFTKCSSDLFDLVQLLLQKDPNQRPTAKEVLEHSFFLMSKRKASQEFNTCFYDSVSRLKDFRVKNKLQQAVLSYLGQQQSTADEKSLIRIFNEIDTDGDGKLTSDELAKALQKLFLQEELESQLHASILMEQIDIDGNGYLEYSEFVMACSKRRTLLTETNLRNAFQQFDLNGDGVISLSEIKQVLEGNEGISDEKWKEMIQEADTNGDGQVSYEEFLVMMKQLL